MNPVEDVLRATARALAEAIPDDNPPPRRATPGGTAPRPSLWRRARPWLIPLAAAAAVLAAIAAALAITGGWDSHRSAPAIRPPAHLPQGLPPYYVSLNDLGRQADVTATASGRVLASVAPPAPYGSFDRVGPGDSSETFVLDASAPGSQRFYLLRFDPRGDTAQLIALKVNLPGSMRPVAMSLSPDGSSLALLTPLDGQTIFDVNLRTGSMLESDQHSLEPGYHGIGWLGWLNGSNSVVYVVYSRALSRYAYGELNFDDIGRNPARLYTPIGYAEPLPVGAATGGGVTSRRTVVDVWPVTRADPESESTKYRGDFGITRYRGGALPVVYAPQTNFYRGRPGPVFWANPPGTIVIMSVDGSPRVLSGGRSWRLPGPAGSVAAGQLAW